MKHHLYPGTLSQVLCPGPLDGFRYCFVGGWLCEKPDMPGMNGICKTEGAGFFHDATGHADILTSPRYARIGCANFQGLWACDLA